MPAQLKVLVVDDDPVITKSFDRVLTKKGYAVITADSGLDALKKLAAADYDVVYTDIKMPGMSGLEVAEQIRAQRPWTPVVIITGYGSEEHQKRAKAAGVAGFLHKPLSPDMIEGSALAALKTATARVTESPAPAAPASAGTAKSVASFLAGLAFFAAFPVVALASLAWLGLRAADKHAGIHAAGQYARNVALFLVSPFFAIFYMATMPMIGVQALIGLGRKAIGKPAVVGKVGRMARKFGLCLASPLIALAYVVVFPLVAVGALAGAAVGRSTGDGPAAVAGRAAHRVAMALAAPFIGFAYYLLYPFVSTVMLVWFGGVAWITEPAN